METIPRSHITKFKTIPPHVEDKRHLPFWMKPQQLEPRGRPIRLLVHVKPHTNSKILYEPVLAHIWFDDVRTFPFTIYTETTCAELRLQMLYQLGKWPALRGVYRHRECTCIYRQKDGCVSFNPFANSSRDFKAWLRKCVKDGYIGELECWGTKDAL